MLAVIYATDTKKINSLKLYNLNIVLGKHFMRCRIYDDLMQGFPQVLRSWGRALQNLMGGWSQYMEEHGGLKLLSKNTCYGVPLIEKLPAISPQACKFTKNELLNTYYWKILARFWIIIFCAFSRNHFMEVCSTFQWRAGGVGGGVGGLTKIVDWGGGRWMLILKKWLPRMSCS